MSAAVGAVVDEERVGRAATERLDAERARSREDVDDFCTTEREAFESVMRQDVEDRLTHLV
jgi:hypothetical protein